MATDVFGDYEDQERHYDKIYEDPLSELSTLREMTTQAATDMRESMKILNVEEHVDIDMAFEIAKMVVEHRMRVMGERY